MNTDSPTAVALGAGVVKRPTRLADGRELIYFDDADTALGAERSVDARTLDPRPTTATSDPELT
ncbi:MAG: galactose-1-phosphate uridylyltransferase, partial [Microbacterium sp.]|nr:galactose-1-phosphate uridylyltransferase [Microbacterium sp.]